MKKLGKKDWENFSRALFKSGIPLELSVSRDLEKVGFISSGPFTYTRKDQADSDLKKDFSVDILASKSIGKESPDFVKLQKIRFLAALECKHQLDDVFWIFPPSLESLISRTRNGVFQELLDARMFNSSVYHRLPDGTKNVVQGVSIKKGVGNPNGKVIYRALNQITFGSAAVISARILLSQLDSPSRETTPCFILLPVIVTTASVAVIKAGLTISDIEKSEDPKEVLEEVDYVVLHQSLSSEQTQFSLDKMKRLKQDFENYIEERNPDITVSEMEKEWNSFRVRNAYFYPTRVIVVQYEKLGPVISTFSDMFISERENFLGEASKKPKEVKTK